MKNVSIRTICYVAMFAAVISVLSIVTIPTPWGVPFTLQTFAIALCGFALGKKLGTVSTLIYLLLGLVGVPVFAGMTAGPAILFASTGGGYLIGFIPMAFFCGLAVEWKNKKNGIFYLILFSVIGLASCHILGSVRLKFLSGSTFLYAFSVGSLPYLIKDILSVVIAYGIAVAIRKALSAANLSVA
jgi:biotin transport system substrate-specific component